ncbi:mitochondrial ribosomal protein L37-domain-containing protein [Usnea florida]
MICPRCTRLLSPSILHSATLRPLSTTSRLLHPESPPPATSTSAAQPFSTPFTPSPSKTPGIPPSSGTTPESAPKGPAHASSSVPAGTPLRGLGYIKGQEGPLAKEDSEYPDWLWGLLEPKQGALNADGVVGDAFAKSKKQRRLAAKAARALDSGSHDSSQAVQVPLEEQSIDLPGGMGGAEGQEAFKARGELTKAMRSARKRKIKESNYLKSLK